MTIAAGYVCVDGLVLCADTEMTGNIRHSGQKAWCRDDGKSAIGIVGAGDAVLIRLIRNRLFERISSQVSMRQAETILEQTLRSVYEDHVDRSPDGNPNAGVLVGVRIGTDYKLFEHSRTAVADVDAFRAIGSGAPVADYLSETLFSDDSRTSSAITLASYVLQQCKRFSLYCGGQSHVIHMPMNGQAVLVSQSRIKRSEELVNQAFDQFAPQARAGFVAVMMGGGGGAPASMRPRAGRSAKKQARKSPKPGLKSRPPSQE